MQDGDEATETVADNRRRHGFRRVHERMHRHPVTSFLTKVVVTMVGLTVIATGLVMLVAPGPGIVAIVIGLGILALEYDWADRAMQAMKRRAHEAAERARALDPAVRRRRAALTLFVLTLTVVGVTEYVRANGWPPSVVRGWDWVQGLSSVIPELPGM